MNEQLVFQMGTVLLANVRTDCPVMEFIVMTHAMLPIVRITRPVSTLEIILTHADVIGTTTLATELA